MVRKKFSADFKAKVAIDAIKNDTTIAELSKKHDVHPSQIKDWKTELLTNAGTLFGRKDSSSDEREKYIESLERKTGQLSMECDFLKKNLTLYHAKKDSK